MIRHVSKIASGIAVIAGLAVAGPAKAADPALIPMIAPAVEQVANSVTEFASGWYLRGDVGYRWNDVGSASAALAPAITTSSLTDVAAFGGGFGYSRDWFRTDITLDWHMAADFTGDVAGTPGYYRGKVDTFTALANAYIDLGTWAGLTPYIGGGAGIASVRTSSFVSAAAPSSARHANTIGFAWAYMAGLTYRMSNNILVDVGYRHLELGDTHSDFDTTGNSITLKDLSSDEVRVGLRYEID